MANRTSFFKNGMKWFSGAKQARRITIDYNKEVPSFKATDIHTNQTIKDRIRTDPDLAANIRRLVDNILMNNPVIIPVQGRTVADSRIRQYENELTTVRFGKVLRSAVYSLIWSGNAFLEIERNVRGQLVGIYFMDPEYIDFVKDERGRVTGYVQEIPGAAKINFELDSVLHMTIDHLNSGVSGESFIGALEQALNRKDIAESYLAWIISNNKLNRFWTITGDVNEDRMTATIQALRYTSKDPNRTPVIQFDKDVEVEFRRYFDTEDFDAILRYIDEQKTAILSILQVPPIIGGNVDSSNRSNSEIQARYVFYNTVRNFQKILVDELNQELVTLLNWSNVEFKFPHSDRASMMEIFKIATAMQGLNFTNEAVLEYLKREGFEPPQVEEVFNEAPEMETGDGNNIDGRNPARPTASREPRSRTGIPQNEQRRQSDRQAGVGEKRN